MQRRLLLGLAILFVVLSMAIGLAVGMTAIHRPAEEALSQAAELAMAGNWEQAVSLARQAYARWGKYRSFTAAFADHSPMDDTERLFREMLVYAQNGEVPHFAACCSQLSAMLRATYETHGFSIKNIL